MTTIGFIEDDTVLLEQICQSFAKADSFSVVITAKSVDDFHAQYQIPDSPLSILFLDIELPGQSGLDALPALKELLPDTEIIIFTVHEDADSLLKAFCAGATGYLLKSTPISALHDYVHIVTNGGSAISAPIAQKLADYVNRTAQPPKLPVLNAKEYEVLALLAEGWSYKLIANKTGLSTDGVRFYIKRIYRALNINSKGEALRIYYTGDLQKPA